jgi:electron transport complex protein RnfG
MIKKIFENTFVRLIVALGLVAVVSGVSLVFVYNYAIPKIKVNVSRETDQAIKNIFPDVAKTESVAGIRRDGVFRVKDASGKLLGYAFIAEGNGYQATIKMLAGIDEKLSTLQGMEVLESQETPGLGAEIASEDFRGQFKGLSVTHPIEYVKNQKPSEPYEIEAITGATISSRAVVTILNKKVEEMRKILKAEE